jgi:hypothetical protein
MNYRFDYICKLITQLKETKNIKLDIVEDDTEFTNTDIRYLILTILMNNGLLLEKKFSDNNWVIDRNDFSSFCTWYGLDGNYSNIAEEPNIDEFDVNINFEVEPTEGYYSNGDDYILSIFKDVSGNVDGSKVMNQIRNKFFHNQFSDYEYGIVLTFAEGELEIEDEDIYVLLESYLKACSSSKIIKQLLYSSGKFQNANYSSEEKNSPSFFDVSKINEIVSMFQFLYLMVNKSKGLNNYSRIQESLLQFNNILNSINEIDDSIISSISQPDFEKVQLTSLLSVIYVLSDLKQIDISSLDFNFMAVNSAYSKQNDNIMRHLRNSFAHGYFTYQGDNIIIEDYNNKQIQTFSAVCSIDDFLNFTLSENVLGKMYDVNYPSGLKK